MEPIGNIPPAEAEERYYAMLDELVRHARMGGLVQQSATAGLHTAIGMVDEPAAVDRPPVRYMKKISEVGINEREWDGA